MPKIEGIPEALRPYANHGLDLNWREGGEQATGTCPFCGREGKFSVNKTTGLWRCFACAEGNAKTMFGGGNVYGFLRALWKHWDESTTDYASLAEDRGLLEPETLLHWGACISLHDGEWVLPGYGADGKLNQLYRYTTLNGHNGQAKKRLLATPTINQQLHGVNLFNKNCHTVYICEGPWDGMVLWEVLQRAKPAEEAGRFVVTGSPSASLLSGISVIAVPGCNTFFDHWLALCEDKDVVLLYDNDHPRKHPTTGKLMPSVGYESVKRVAGLVGKSEHRIRSLSYLWWGDEGYDADLPDGFDVRDYFKDLPTMQERVDMLPNLAERFTEVPQEWLGGRTLGSGGGSGSTTNGTGSSSSKNGDGKLGDEGCLPCTSWATVVNAMKKTMRWIDGLDQGLAAIYACILSTESVGDQLWIKLIGPPSCGKSVLCEAVSINERYVIAKSTMRGFHSGYQSDKGGGEDNSLVFLANGKTLITKDGDTLLQAPNLSQILSEARDVYDRVSRTHYRNKASKDYKSINLTWVLSGTNSLRSIDSSELGERFIDIVIMDEIDDDIEDDVAMQVAHTADRNMSHVADGKEENLESPERMLAKRLAGGYVTYLRQNAQVLLDQVQASEQALHQCTRFAKFVAYMRARPSKCQEEKAERELSYRLTSQLVRMAKCLAAVLEKKEIDQEVMRRVHKATMDTSRGRTLDICKQMYKAGAEGLELTTLALLTNQQPDEEKKLVRFLRRIGAVEPFHVPGSRGGATGKVRWKLVDRLQKLYREVMSVQPTPQPTCLT